MTACKTKKDLIPMAMVFCATLITLFAVTGWNVMGTWWSMLTGTF